MATKTALDSFDPNDHLIGRTVERAESWLLERDGSKGYLITLFFTDGTRFEFVTKEPSRFTYPDGSYISFIPSAMKKGAHE